MSKWRSSCDAYLYFIISLHILYLSSIFSLVSVEHMLNAVSLSPADELEAQIFPGNSSVTDYFRLLQRDGDSLLIGAR